MRTSRWPRILAPLALVLVLVSAAAAADSAAPPGPNAEIAKLEQSIEREGWSAAALVSLANAHADEGDHGRAILALERARILAPADATVTRTLKAQRELAGITSPSTSRVDAVVSRASPDTWSWLALGGLTVACGGVLLLAWSARRRLGVTATAVGAALAVLCGLGAVRAAPNRGLAIVVGTEPARIAPLAAADITFAPRPGERVRVEQWRGEHVYVRADAQRSGWMPRTAIGKVIPADRLSSRA